MILGLLTFIRNSRKFIPNETRKRMAGRSLMSSASNEICIRGRAHERANLHELNPVPVC